jgi:hypothetical protein
MLTFTAAAFFFTSATSFVACYYSGIAAEADPSGHGYNMLLWIMLGHFLLSLALVLRATRPHRMASRYDAPATA